MNYLEKSEAALIKAEESIDNSETAKHWIEIAEKWKSLADVKGQTTQIPPHVAPRLKQPRTDFRSGQYL